MYEIYLYISYISHHIKYPLLDEYFMAIDNMDYTYIFQRKILLKWKKYKIFFYNFNIRTEYFLFRRRVL